MITKEPPPPEYDDESLSAHDWIERLINPPQSEFADVQTVKTVLAEHYEAVHAIQELLQVPEEENVECAERIKHEVIKLKEHSSVKVLH